MFRSQAMVILSLVGALLAGCGASPAGTKQPGATPSGSAAASTAAATQDADVFPSGGGSGAYGGGASGTPGY